MQITTTLIIIYGLIARPLTLNTLPCANAKQARLLACLAPQLDSLSPKNMLLLRCIFLFLPDLKDKEILQKVCNEEQCTVKEPLPDDCPKELEQLINDCRAYSDFERPSAGGKLSSHPRHIHK